MPKVQTVTIEDVGWSEFLKLVGLPTDLDGLVMPEHKEGFDRQLVIPRGITAEQAFLACKELFLAWKYTEESLDTAVPTNDRDASKGAYGLWLRDRQEADEELQNKSAEDLTKLKIPTMTLTERLVLEVVYCKETGQHLDLINVTLCAGSRYSDGIVPEVHWYEDELRVDWRLPRAAAPVLRGRAVVS